MFHCLPGSLLAVSAVPVDGRVERWEGNMGRGTVNVKSCPIVAEQNILCAVLRDSSIIHQLVLSFTKLEVFPKGFTTSLITY